MRALDLFCGAGGGWSLGLHRAGIPTVAACEIDPWRRAVYGRNNPGVRLYEDVRTLTADRLVRDLGYLPDVIVGSPPCQDASSANHHGKGVDGERTGLFFDATRLVDECRPVWFAFENASRLAHRGGERLCAELEALGYDIWPLVMGARAFGAPHERPRLWIVGVDTNQDHEPGRAFDGEMAGVVGECPWREPWAEAAPSLRVLADGLSTGLANKAAAALGDAVLPQITEAIARTMLRLLPERAAA